MYKIQLFVYKHKGYERRVADQSPPPWGGLPAEDVEAEVVLVGEPLALTQRVGERHAHEACWQRPDGHDREGDGADGQDCPGTRRDALPRRKARQVGIVEHVHHFSSRWCTQSIILANNAKNTIAAEAIISIADLQRIANFWNIQSAATGANSKYVNSVLINPNTGAIEINYNSTALGVANTENTLVISPYIRGVISEALPQALANGSSGAIDWACSSQTQTVAISAGYIGATLGTLQSKYAPANCR